MRILHIDSGREMRGGQWQALYLMQGLAALGHEQVLMSVADSPLQRAATARGLTTVPLTMPALARRTRKCDILHAHSARAHALAAPFARERLVVARRVAFSLQHSAVSRWKYRRAAHVVAVSEFVRSVLVRDGVPAPNISVVYDGVALPAAPARAHDGLTVAIDSADPLKGRAMVERAADLARVSVRFSTDLMADLPHAALFLYITESEGLGSAALLASAHGVPVVASRVGGLPEAVEDGVTGLLTANDPAAIATAITRLLGNRALAEEMGANGRRRVAERFTIEAMVRGTVAVYQRVLDCSKR